MTHTQRQALQGRTLPGPNTHSAQSELTHVRIDKKHGKVAASKRASTRGPSRSGMHTPTPILGNCSEPALCMPASSPTVDAKMQSQMDDYMAEIKKLANTVRNK